MIYVKQASTSDKVSPDFNQVMSVVNSKFNALTQKISKSVTYVEYSTIATANPYVPPYTHIVQAIVPYKDIENIGVPISVSAYGSAGQSVPATLEHTDGQTYYYTAVSTSEKIRVIVVFLDVVHIV